MDDIVAGYLRRLGLGEAAPPSVEALIGIHRAHVERVAYNTVDIQIGRPTPIHPPDVARRIATTGRGGYCFHLNGALEFLLDQLGYDVRRHRGGVWKSPGDTPMSPKTNHLVLTVHGLPSGDNPGGDWFVDAGLGDALYEPLPLLAGEYRQAPYGYALSASPKLPDTWRFVHDPAGSFTGMDFESALAAPDAFDASHRYLSTDPASGFVRFVNVQRRDATGVDKLISCNLRRVEDTGTVSRELNRAEFFAALADVFRLDLDDLDADDRDALYRRARAGQDDWLASVNAG